MNILVIGKFYIEGFALHIAETLAAMGNNVRRFEPGIKTGRIGGKIGHRVDQIRGLICSAADGLPAIRSSRMRSLWREVEEDSVDLVIVCHDFLWPAEVAELKRRSKAKICMWFPDAIVNFGRAFFMNAEYDALFFKDPYIVSTIREVLKSPVYYLPECFNPEAHCSEDKNWGNTPEYKCDIATAGNQHSWRVAFLKNFEGYNVKLWGNSSPLWLPSGAVSRMYQGRGVYCEDKVKAFRGAKIVLNNLHYGEIWGLNARAFEAAGSGAFQMLDWRPGLSQLFEDGKELVSFRGIQDLKKKIDYWLPREDERRKIAEAGMKRAYSQHTYQSRLALLLDTMLGRSSGYPVPDIRCFSD